VNALQLHWHPPNPARNLAGAGFPKNGQIPDKLEPKSSKTLHLRMVMVDATFA